MSKRASVHAKQLEVLDPLVVELAQIGAGDPDYVGMLNDVENRVPPPQRSSSRFRAKTDGGLPSSHRTCHSS